MQQRPKFLDLSKIKLPLSGFASILHRISGFLLILAIPFLLYFFYLSLHSEETFTLLTSILDFWCIKILLAFLLWSFLHHFCMGVRILLIDAHIGVSLSAARLSAKLVFLISFILWVILGKLLLL